jgi:hypothetical protein
MTELPRLIIDAQTRALALKTAADDFVGWLNNLRADIAKCEEELAQKRRAGDTEIAKLRSTIAELSKEQSAAERNNAEARSKIEREKREWDMEKKRVLKSFDDVLVR